MASNDTGDDQRRQMSNNVEGIVWAVLHGEEDVKVRAAKEIRNMTKTSARSRAKLAAGGVIVPLVKMLSSSNMEVKEAALLALLNLAVKNEKNKIAIGKAGAIELLVGLLESKNARLKEHAAAAILTLSASSVNKPIIGSSGATQLLVELLTIGSHQGKIDAVLALYNLSTYPDNLAVILAAEPVPALIELLKEWRKSSRGAEKISALLESLSALEEGRTCILKEEGGILTLVEVIEDGSLQSREHAVGALLTMCESKKYNYREAILKEGVIPGLFELIIQGTPKAQEKARALLQALREAPSLNKTDSASIALETIVYDHVDDIEKGSEAARKLFTEMVQASMEQSMDQHLKQNALVCMPSEFTKTNILAKVPSM